MCAKLMQQRENAPVRRILGVQQNHRQRLVPNAGASHFVHLHTRSLENEHSLCLHRRAPRVQGLIRARPIRLRPPSHGQKFTNVVARFLRIHAGMQRRADAVRRRAHEPVQPMAASRRNTAQRSATSSSGDSLPGSTPARRRNSRCGENPCGGSARKTRRWVACKLPPACGVSGDAWCGVRILGFPRRQRVQLELGAFRRLRKGKPGRLPCPHEELRLHQGWNTARHIFGKIKRACPIRPAPPSPQSTPGTSEKPRNHSLGFLILAARSSSLGGVCGMSVDFLSIYY